MKNTNSKNQYITDILFTKEMIKTLEDTIMDYYPQKHFEILPLFHKAYDNLSLALYKLEK